MRLLLLAVCWLTRNVQSFPGRWRVVAWLRRHGAQLNRIGGVRIRFEPGCEVEVMFRTNRDVCIEGITRDATVFRWYRRLLKEGDCMLDVGANMGLTALLAARLVGVSGRVYAFEPSPEVVQNLRNNVRLNRRENVVVYPVAISNQTGKVEFNVASAVSALSSMRDLGSVGDRHIHVDAVTADSLLDNFSTIKLVKIDVEGAEQLALEGMTHLLERDRPYLILELTDAWLRTLGGSSDEVCSLLRKHGYALYQDEQGGLKKLDAAPARQIEMLCVPQHRVSELAHQFA